MHIEHLEQRQLLSAGALDVSFGSAGTVTVPMTGAGASDANMVALHDGRIVIASIVRADSGDGTFAGSPDDQLALQFLTADGAPDRSIGHDPTHPGQLLVALPDARPIFLGALRLRSGPDDHIYANFGNRVLAFDSRGEAVTSFGTAGVVTLSSIASDDFEVLADGTLLFAGSSRDHVRGDYASLQHFDANGVASRPFTLPHTFNFYYSDGSFGQIVPLANGGAYVVGMSDFEEFSGSVFTARLNADLSFDRTFARGKTIQNFGLSEVRRITLGAASETPDGGLLFSYYNELVSGTLLRVDRTGAAIDVPELPVLTSPNAYGYIVFSLFAMKSGTYMLTYPFGIPDPIYVARLNADGSMDRTFNKGKPIIGENEFHTPITMRVASDGSLVVLNYDSDRDQTSVVLRRLWRNDAPAARAATRDVTSSVQRTAVIDVTYRDDQQVDRGSFDRRDLRVTGPNGFVGYAKFDRVLVASSGDRTVTARYKIAIPRTAADGTYTVRLRDDQVRDNDGNASDSRTMGTFRVG